MVIRIEPKSNSRVPVQLMNVIPDQLREKSTAEICRMRIPFGKLDVELGELFNVEGEKSDQLICEGDFSNANRLGARMNSGSIRVIGRVGNHVGSQMSGGELRVDGNAGDYAGAEMTGGKLRVKGNAGDFLGAAYPGNKTGMNRGVIQVCGHVGKAAGFRMRRGLVVVEGNADEHFGWQMRAGTLICLGQQLGELPTTGMEMVRGSIILIDESSAGLLPTFRPSFFGPQPVFGLLENELQKLGVSKEHRADLGKIFQAYSGDHLTGGRGEVFTLAE